jgi:hypothetical protein
MGWLEPTELGERFMPALTSLGAYHEEISRDVAEQSLPNGEPISPGRRNALARDALRFKVTDQAAAALGDLELELHDVDGKVIPTRYISLQDAEYLLALAGDDEDVADCDIEALEDLEPDETDEFSAALIELGVEEPAMPADWDCGPAAEQEQPDWNDSPSTLPRYQIFVDLVDGTTLPVSDRWKDDPYVQLLIAGFDPFVEKRDTD